MSAIRYSVPQTVQPQEGVGVAWSNPLARGLTFAWTKNVAQYPGRRIATPYGSNAVSRYGVGRAGNGSSTFATLERGSIKASTAYGLTATSGAKVTYLAVAKIGAAASQNHFFNSSSGSGTALGFRTNTTSVGLAQASGGSILNFTSAVTAGETCIICISGGNGDTNFFKNGALVANSAVSYASGISDGTPEIGRNGSGTQYGDHEIYLLLAFERGLTVAEGIELTRNPWQLFAPSPKRIWVPASAPAASTGAGLIRRNVPWTVQPQYATGINWANPITRGLVLAPDAAIVRDNVSRSIATKVNGPTVEPTAKGLANRFVAASSQYITYPYVNANSAGFTLFCLASFTDTATQRGLITLANTSNSDRITLFVGQTANKVSVVTTLGGFGNAAASTTTVGANTQYAVAATWRGPSDGNDESIWLNGVKEATSAAGSGSSINTTNIGIGARYNTAWGSFGNGTICAPFVWNRALTDAEIASVSANPWQIFAFLPRTIWAPAAAGGGGGFLAAWARRQTRSIGAGVI